MGLENIQNIILVLSGKGGVGKSSTTTQLALSLSLLGHPVGVLDIDLTGPSIPRFFGIEEKKVRQAPGGWIPVPVHSAQKLPLRKKPAPPEREGENGVGNGNGVQDGKEEEGEEIGALSCMSLGFILASRNDAVIWRGPKKTAMIKQFLTDVLWPPLSYLLIDTPPGTSDEHISLLENLHLLTATPSSPPNQLSGAIIITTPQAISISDVRKEINFCAKTGVPILGVIENMSGFVCPHCSECTNVFSKGGGEVMAREFGVKFLGSCPIDPTFVRLIEEGVRPGYPAGTVGGRVVEKQNGDGGEKKGEEEKDEGLLVDKYRDSALWPIFEGIVREVVNDIEEKKRGAS